MISASDLRKIQLTEVNSGYSVEEVNAVINEAATTIEAYTNENKELYHKLEVLACKIEEYRTEEDSIKTALIMSRFTQKSRAYSLAVDNGVNEKGHKLAKSTHSIDGQNR